MKQEKYFIFYLVNNNIVITFERWNLKKIIH